MPPLKAQLLLEESLSAYFPEMVFTDSGITVQLHRNTQKKQMLDNIQEHKIAHKVFAMNKPLLIFHATEDDTVLIEQCIFRSKMNTYSGLK